MEAKQHASAQPTNHRRNIKRNQNIIEMNENENMTTQSLWNPVKVVLRGTFIAIQAYLKKQEKNQTNNLVLHLKQLEKDSSRKKKKNKTNKIRNKNGEITTDNREMKRILRDNYQQLTICQ